MESRKEKVLRALKVVVLTFMVGISFVNLFEDTNKLIKLMNKNEDK